MNPGRLVKAWLAAALCLALAETVWARQPALSSQVHRKQAPKPVAMTVLGPELVPAESNALYTANIRYDNATTRIVEPVWAIAGDLSAAHIGSDGILSANPLAENTSIEVVACFTDGETAIAGTREVTLLASPPRTAAVSEMEVRPRHPWNGWLDIDYTLETDPPGTVAAITLSAFDHVQGCPLPAKILAGDGARGGPVPPGRHRLSWNLGADHPDIPASRVDITLEAFPSVSAATPCGEKCRQGGLKAAFHDLGAPNPEASPWKSRYRDVMAFFGAREAALATNTAYLGSNFDFGYTERGTCRFPGKYAIWSTEAFAVLFEGQIDIPEDGTYTFGSLSDDGVSLFIDRKRVYETTKRRNFGDGMSSGTIALKAGLHDIAIAYYEGGGQQGLQVYWQTPSETDPLPLPQSVLYWSDEAEERDDPPAEGLSVSFFDLDGTGSPYATWASSCEEMKEYFAVRSPILATNTACAGRVFDFGYTPWGGTCAFPGKYANASADDFAALFTGSIIIPETGKYRFQAYSDDGSTLYIDNHLVFAAFDGQDRSKPYGGSIALAAGEHSFALAYHERGERQGMSLYWQPPSAGEWTLLPQSVLRHWRDKAVPAGGRAGRTGKGRYLVVDLSGGPDAKRWPVKFLDTAPAGGFNTDEYKTKKLVLLRIEAGSFTMGSPPDELGRYANEDLHPVTLTKPYYIGLFEMTQRQWELAMGNNPSQDKGPTRPVECTSYDDIRGRDAGSCWPASNAVDPCSLVGKLRAKTGLSFDLPTDAQWEHACRAGAQTALYTGVNLTAPRHDAAVDQIARYGYDNGTHGGIRDGKGGYPERHTAVGSYRPNAWGLYDMGGNVWELCRDWYALYLGPSAATDPAGPPSGQERVRRGGAWDNAAWHCRSASRDHFGPSDPAFANGFRLACETE
jgi:formylglycine-generating enzyme required for sulfatase activity